MMLSDEAKSLVKSRFSGSVIFREMEPDFRCFPDLSKNSKSGRVKALVGSNPTASARKL